MDENIRNTSDPALQNSQDQVPQTPEVSTPQVSEDPKAGASSAYEPNFILKPAAPAEDAGQAEASAESAGQASKPEASAESTGQAKTAAGNAGQSEAAGHADPSDVLKAARARAEALKAAAAKAEQTAEPYRRETGEIPEHRFGSTAGRAAGAAGSGFGSINADGPMAENPSFDPGKTGSYTDPRENFRPGGAYSGSSSYSGGQANSGFRAGSAYSGGSSYSGGAYSGGQAGGGSASWSNGEVHRSHAQVKEQLRKQGKQKKAPQPVMLTRKAMALLIASCLLLCCLFGLGGAALGSTLMQKNLANTAQTTTTGSSSSGAAASTAGYSLENATGSSMTVKEITAATKNSVVEIRTEAVASDTWMQQYVTEGAGSGVIISKDGYIMTNNHVIEGASKIKVTTADEKEYEAKLVGADETNDVAVLKIEASGLTPATYGNSDQLEVGDMAVAIGNPLGELGGTVTAGIISATDRALSIDGKTLHLLQTDSSINPGNSGGGLFNGNGQLIGLVVAKSAGSDVEGLGFAIPINTAANVAQQLIDKGYVSGQPSTGMTYQEGTSGSGSGSDPFSQFDSFFGSGTQKGVYIYSVNGENAKAAGFQPGDQVYAVDGEEITSFDDLSAIVTAHKVGDKLKFTIIRDGVQKTIKLELEEKTASQSTDGQNAGGQDQNGQSQDGQNSGNQSQDGQQVPDQNGDLQLPDDGQTSPGFGWPDFFDLF